MEPGAVVTGVAGAIRHVSRSVAVIPIFILKVAQLCIGHLGYLHHPSSPNSACHGGDYVIGI
jgi:hypothetical protein